MTSFLHHMSAGFTLKCYVWPFKTVFFCLIKVAYRIGLIVCPIKISVASVDHFEAKENLERKKGKGQIRICTVCFIWTYLKPNCFDVAMFQRWRYSSGEVIPAGT